MAASGVSSTNKTQSTSSLWFQHMGEKKNELTWEAGHQPKGGKPVKNTHACQTSLTSLAIHTVLKAFCCMMRNIPYKKWCRQNSSPICCYTSDGYENASFHLLHSLLCKCLRVQRSHVMDYRRNVDDSSRVTTKGRWLHLFPQKRCEQSMRQVVDL